MSIAGDAARERFPFSHYAKQMSTEPGPAWNDTEGRNKNQAALLMRQINAAADEPDESYTTYCENLIAHAIGQACAQKDQEIALLKEQIRVADVAFQGLFEASAAKDKRIAELEAEVAVHNQMWEDTAAKDKRIAELDEKEKGFTQFAFATGEAAAKKQLRITQMETQLSEHERANALLTIKLTSVTESYNIVNERIRDLEEMENGLTKAFSNIQQAAFKLSDTNKAMAALLDRVPHYRLYPPDCAPDCPACAWAKIKPTGLAGQTPSNPGGGATGTPGGCSPKV